ncbi:MAG: DUF3604 domain-containing protein, partial [Candidatus Wallbacteria bacterium]|nr:DUF3604 domain-containing protein [Candidatus Wallbacteria bacterium]
ELPEPLWQRSREAASRADAPGRFVAFLGFEWTPARSWGHRTVLFSGREGAVVPCGSARGATPGQLWRALDHYPCLGIPHHPSSEPIEHHRFDWSSHVPSQEPLVEIFSQWNRSKEQLMGMDSETNPNGVQAALVSGKRLGFVGGSDSHTAMGGRTGGLAALRAPRLDRDSLWRALMNRRTYATTGARILLDVRVADEPPDPGLAIEVHATAPVTRLEIVKGWHGAPIPLGAFTVPIPLDSEDIKVLWRDPAPVRDSFYYARVLQSDGARAWSSPVWVSRSGARAPSGDTIEWMKLPLGNGWSAGALESPAPAIPALTLLPDGVEVRTPAIPWITREPRRRVSYFHARIGPIAFVEGRRYRLKGTLGAERPTIAILHTLDDRTRNPGLFCAVELKGTGHKASIERSFDARLTTGASLHLFLPVGDNRVRLSELSIEEARAAR